jgi:hypothetical protein
MSSHPRSSGSTCAPRDQTSSQKWLGFLIAFLRVCSEREQQRISSDLALQAPFLALLTCVVSCGRPWQQLRFAIRSSISRRLVFDASAPQCIATPRGWPLTCRALLLPEGSSGCAARRASRHYKTRYKTLTLTPKFVNDFNVKQKYRRFPAVRTNCEMPARRAARASRGSQRRASLNRW